MSIIGVVFWAVDGNVTSRMPGAVAPVPRRRYDNDQSHRAVDDDAQAARELDRVDRRRRRVRRNVHLPRAVSHRGELRDLPRARGARLHRLETLADGRTHDPCRAHRFRVDRARRRSPSDSRATITRSSCRNSCAASPSAKRPIEFSDHGPIAHGQMALEDKHIARGGRLLHSGHRSSEHGRVLPPLLRRMSAVDRSEARRSDDRICICSARSDIPWVADGVRDRGHMRDEMHEPVSRRASLRRARRRVMVRGGGDSTVSTAATTRDRLSFSGAALRPDQFIDPRRDGCST